MAPKFCFGRRWKSKKHGGLFLMAVLGIVCVHFALKRKESPELGKASASTWESSNPSRKLLSTAEWEKCEFELGFPRNHSIPAKQWHTPTMAYLWVALYVFLTLTIFIALAIVCDDFFVPSLEVISEKLDLSEDVAGATFMAAGSSAPELFTSIAGVTVESDVGVGTIVGSAVFNLLGIVALSAAFAGSVLNLDWRPLVRDSTFYALSIGLFIVFAWDGKFYLYESIIMLGMYIVYISIMKVNYKLMELMGSCSRKAPIHPSCDGKNPALTYTRESMKDDTANAEDFTNCGTMSPARSSTHEQHEAITKIVSEKSIEIGSPSESRRFSHLKRGQLAHSISGAHEPPVRRSSFHVESGEKRTSSLLHNQNSVDVKEKDGSTVTEEPHSNEPITNGSLSPKREHKEVEEKSGDEKEEGIMICPCLPIVKTEVPSRSEDERGCFSCFKLVLHWLLFLVSFPFVVAFSWTIPDCAKPRLQKLFVLSFVMSVVWIAVLSFAMVTVVGRAGCILGVDKFTMGLVVVAIGTSVPDALSSILVARDGYGDMAVSNAIGSNVFDIDLGLGLPFLISILIRKMKPVRLLTPHEEVQFERGEIKLIAHVKFGFLLLLILFMSLIVVCIAKFKLSKKLGLVFFIMYIMFVAYAYVQDVYCDNNC